MSILTAAMRELMAAGISGEDLIAAVERIEAAAIPVRSKGAERQARYEARKRQKASESVIPDDNDASDDTPSLEGFPPAPPFPNPNPPPSPPMGAHGSTKTNWPADYWEQFWRAYPHKVGKGAALKAISRLAKRGKPEFSELLDGLARYVSDKPPDRPYCNPATWLNEERWADEPATVSQTPKTNGGRNGPSVSDQLREMARQSREGREGRMDRGAGGYDARMLPRPSGCAERDDESADHLPDLGRVP